MNSVHPKLPVLAGVVLAAAGCATIDPPELPETDVPAEWQGPIEPAAEVWPDTEWWTRFDTPELTALVEDVKANNLDLANNQRNLISAQITLREAGFSLWPTPVLSLGTGTSFTQIRVDGSSTSGNSSGPFQLSGSVTYNGILSKPATYERAAADYDSRVAQAADLALNTLGTAASTYFQVLLTRDRIRAAQQNLENAEAIGAIARARVNAGVAVPIEALQQQIAIERERANLSSLYQNDLSARASLALLLGRSVQGFDVGGQTLEDIEVPVVQPGLPSDLLVRRPDLVQAEAAVRGATASVNVVRTNFFPQISLTGTDNASSSSLTNLVSSPNTSLNIGANLVQTLLDNGQRRRNVEQARISLESSLANYRRAVLAAFNEIEVQLSNIELLEAQGEVARRNLDAAEESFRIAQARYGEGVADYQTVLTSQNTLFSTRTSYLDNKLQRLNAIVGLYQALGGGWEADAEDADSE